MIYAEFVSESWQAKEKSPALKKRRGNKIIIMDPIADMFSRIRNALLAKKESVNVPASQIKLEIARFLQKKGFIEEIKKRGKKTKKIIKLVFFSDGTGPKINNIAHISKPSRRAYSGYRELKPHSEGRGTYIVSTPKGIMDGKEAKKSKVGGEILGIVY